MVWTVSNEPCKVEGCPNPRRSKNPRGEGGWYCPSHRMGLWIQDNPDRFKATVLASSRRQREAKREYLQRYKVEQGCVDCGYNAHPEALQFDHLGEKDFALSRAPFEGISWERVHAEIAKCEVVCANCHAVRTATRRVEASA